MALFDDKRFLLSHIRHSFITGDDTGMSDAVMLNEILPHRNKNDDDFDLLEELMIETKSELESAQSNDIVLNMGVFGSHRQRSNTAMRLDRLDFEKKNKAKVKIVQWRDISENHSINDQERDDYFPIKSSEAIIQEKQRLVNKKSLLSKQMQKYPTTPVNPFNEYSRYDARLSETNGNSKRLTIYLKMLNEEEHNKPLVVEVVNTAKIQDLIGLICWQFTNMRKDSEPLLNANVSNYCLRIAEENGDVYPDFPCFIANEPISKFGFPTLALEERKFDDENRSIIIHFENDSTEIEPPNQEITIADLIEIMIERHKFKADQHWVLKQLNSSDTDFIDPNTKLSELKEYELRLVSLDDLEPRNDIKYIDTNEIPDLEPIEATLYKCFNVLILQKYSNPVEVQLDISDKKVDVTPLGSKNVKTTLKTFWKLSQIKPTSFNVEDIRHCFITKSELPDDRSIFKIIFLNGQTEQSLKFEGTSETVNKIVNKLNYLMQMRSSNMQTSRILRK